MAAHCANCRSTDVMAGLHENHCLNCGAATNVHTGEVERHEVTSITTTKHLSGGEDD